MLLFLQSGLCRWERIRNSTAALGWAPLRDKVVLGHQLGRRPPEGLEHVGKPARSLASRAHLKRSPAESLSRRTVSTKGLLKGFFFFFFAHMS